MIPRAVTAECFKKADFFICDTPYLLDVPNATQTLEEGTTLMYFSCKVGAQVAEFPALQRHISQIVNLSRFEDEQEMNGAPVVDCFDPEDVKQYTFLSSAYAAIFPRQSLSDISPENVASLENQRDLHHFGSNIFALTS